MRKRFPVKKRMKPRGSGAIIKKIDDKWGLKLFLSEKIRDRCYNMQVIVHELGFAPKVGEKRDEDGRFGYVTELATVLFPKLDIGSMKQALAKKKYEPEINQLVKDMKKVGLLFKDPHILNIGFIGEKMVCIDLEHVYDRRNS